MAKRGHKGKLLSSFFCGSEVAEAKPQRRGDGNDPYLTDGGNYILDCACTALEDPEQVAARLNAIPGVVEHGLFINLARAVIVGEEDGARVLEL